MFTGRGTQGFFSRGGGFVTTGRGFSGGAAQLLSFDHTTPSPQTFPATPAAAAALTGLTWTDVATFNIASGNVTTAAGATLTARGTVRYNKTVPLWNGSTMLGHKAVEFRGASDGDGFTGSTSLLNLSRSTTIVFAYRVARPSTANRSLMRKRQTQTSAGWAINVALNGGNPTGRVGDGSSTVTIDGPGITTSLDSAHGAVLWSALQMDLTAGKGRMYSFRAVGAEATLPAGTKTNNEAFKIGGWESTLFDHEGLQLLWMGWLLDADAEAFTLAHLNLLDNVCRPPATISTYSRYSAVSPVVAYEPGFGVRVQHLAGSVTMPSVIHFAHQYNAAATLSPQKLGAYMARATALLGEDVVQKRNLALQSDNFANAAWTKTNVTAAANAAEDPAGITAAASLTASAANGIVSQVFTTLADKPYAWSVFVRRNGGSDVSLKLRLVDVDATATIAEVAATATSEWTRISMIATDETATTIRAELEIVTNGASVFATFAQMEVGWLTAYQHQRAALLDRTEMVADIDNAGGRYFNPVGGRVEVTVVSDADHTPSEWLIFSAGASRPDAGLADALTFSVLHTGENWLWLEHHSSNADFEVIITAPDIDRSGELTYAYAWDSRQPVKNGKFAIISQGGTEYSDEGALVPTAPWIGKGIAPPTTIHAGNQFGGHGHLEGIVELLEVWGPAP